MDGSNMPRAGKAQAFWNGTKKFATFMRRDFAEWFVGSWALILGWTVFALIFFNFLIMDGTFSRGLGEGSGVNPDRFQQVGWAYRIFAALFMMLAIKLTNLGLKRYAWAIRCIGMLITAIVIMHATGFGLKALEGKRSTATAVEAVAVASTQSNDAIVAQLRGQIADIDTQLAAAVAPINTEIHNLDNDNIAANDKRSDALRARRDAIQDDASKRKADLNSKITDLVTAGGTAKTDNAEALAKNEKWAPLFVGLAQFFTWTQTPTDWAIYLCGVIFLIFWVIVGDAIAIVTPSALYALHLADAKNPKVKLSPDAYKNLQERADELERRMANLSAGAQQAQTTKKKKKNREITKNLIADQRTEMAKKEYAEKQAVDDAIDLMTPGVREEEAPAAEAEVETVDPEPEPVAEEPQPEVQEPLELTDEIVEESEAEPEAEEPEFHPPAIIEADEPANDEDEEQPPRIQAAE